MAHALWRSAPEEARTAFVNGEDAQIVQSEYGLNEHLIEFLRERGWWEWLTALRPQLGKPNGKNAVALNGAWVMVNLAHLGHLEHADPLLKDGKLMLEAGFTLREVSQAQKLEKGVAHRDTLRNHCKRIPVAESERVLYGSVAWQRQHKQFRGHWYAVDGFRLEVYGEQYEGAGKVWDRDENRWVRGYKVVAIVNVTRDRERIVGLAMGPIQMDERELLKQILAAMRQHGLEPREMMAGLILDRGYWGAGFLGWLRSEYGLHWCTLVPAYVDLHQVVAKLEAEKKLQLTPRVVTYRSGRQEKLRVGSVQDLVAVGQDGERLATNVVLARRVDEKTGEVQNRLFASSLPLTELKPVQVVEKYSERWAIENEGFREFSQRWKARVPIARKRAAIYAQLTMLALCYNAMQDYRMKRPKEAEALRQECRRRARRSYLAGAGVIVFIPHRRIYAVMGGEELVTLSRNRTLRRIEQLLARGVSPQEAIQRVKAERF